MRFKDAKRRKKKKKRGLLGWEGLAKVTSATSFQEEDSRAEGEKKKKKERNPVSVTVSSKKKKKNAHGRAHSQKNAGVEKSFPAWAGNSEKGGGEGSIR